MNIDEQYQQPRVSKPKCPVVLVLVVVLVVVLAFFSFRSYEHLENVHLRAVTGGYERISALTIPGPLNASNSLGIANATAASIRGSDLNNPVHAFSQPASRGRRPGLG